MSTASDVLDLLRRHYIRDMPNGVFAPEIGAPDSDRRADLIWQGLTRSSGRLLVGHEIKVTRRDLRNELADPAKADAWKRYCDRWYLVVPHESLIEGIELPTDWGVLTPPSGRCTRRMTVTREAPDLHPVDQAPALRTIAAWLFYRHHWLEIENEHLRAAAATEQFGGAA